MSQFAKPDAHKVVSSVPLDWSTVEGIARTYQQSHPNLVPDIRCIELSVRQAFSHLPVLVDLVDFDPYPDLWALQADVVSTNRLSITTRNNQALLTPETNLQFRAVHDYDHLREGLNFSVWGEVKAAKVWCARVEDDAMQAFLFSEIVAQACAAVVSGSFAPQKYVRFPKRFRDEVFRSV